MHGMSVSILQIIFNSAGHFTFPTIDITTWISIFTAVELTRRFAVNGISANKMYPFTDLVPLELDLIEDS